MKLDLGAFEGSSDQWVFMIFGCAILLYFTVFFEWFWCFEVVRKGDVDVSMTLTFAGCGMGPYIAQQAEWRLAEVEGIEDINVDLVFDPPWTPDMITEEGKRLLGLD